MEEDNNIKESWLRKSDDANKPFSRWWIILIGFVLIYGFGTLITLTVKAYTDKPPIPEKVVDKNGNIIFTGADVLEGQTIFLEKGLMDNGTIWGHGAYLGPDYPALTLHRVGVLAQEMIAQKNYGKSYKLLSKQEAEMVKSAVRLALKTNNFNSDTKTLVFNDYEVANFPKEQIEWKKYFSDPTLNGGLKANLITDSVDLKKLSAYFSWAAWVSVVNRPGENYSYTNNFPYDDLVGNNLTVDAVGWSTLSIIFLLGGIGLILYILGKNKQWDWHSPSSYLKPYLNVGQASPTEKALVKFVVVVGLLLFAQTLVGGAVAHYRADPGNFYGLDLSKIFPSSLVRTWHLQLAIFWIATGFVAGGLYIAQILGGIEFKGQRILVNILFSAFALVIFGSLFSEWIGLSGLWDNLSFWLGSQGWEYLELGRLWQVLMLVGLFSWFFILLKSTRPALKSQSTRKLTRVFLISAFAIPFFYLPALFYGPETNFTVVDTWRFWIIHLWVEGFFELFATTMVALVFVELGLVTKRVGLQVIYLDAILIFMGGIIGTGHHWYFSGQTPANMALSGCFSALEVVPLIVLCVEGYTFMKTATNPIAESAIVRYKWPLRFLMAVGFWNFLGAGVFGFLINLPMVSYFEVGTYLTPNHGHASMMGVFGFLSIGLCTYILRSLCTDKKWKGVEKWIKTSFWGLNVGLAMMLVFSLLPGGFAQLWDVVNNGYWHARSIEYVNDEFQAFIGWLRMPGDVIFILLGAIPFLYASLKVYLAKKL